MSVTAKYWNGESSLRLIASGSRIWALEVAAEVAQDVEAVGPLGRGRQRRAGPGPDVVQEPLVARGGGVVELVDDDVVVAVGGQVVERPAVVALDRDEQVVELLGLAAADEQVAEVRVAEHGPEGPQALPQQLLAVGDEQQPGPTAWPPLARPAPAAVVERRDHRLAGPGRGDDEVAVAALHARSASSRSRISCWKA